MQRQLQLRYRRRSCRARVIGLVCCFCVAGTGMAGTLLAPLFAQHAFAAPQALPATIAVTTSSDDYDATAPCSLREAIQSANDDADFGGCAHSGGALTGATIISIPVGTYTLTRDGIDDDLNLTADLDIDGSVTLDGAGGAGDVVIKGKAGYSGRIMHVVSGSVSLKDMTLRDGNLPGGRFGGGLRTNPGTSTTLTNVVVGVNSADRGGGGILNSGVMTLNGSAVTNNQSLDAIDFGGGGILNDVGATLTLNDSRVLGNTVKGDNGGNLGGKGGGIYSAGVAALTLNNTEVDGNIADAPEVIRPLFTQGGGVFSEGSLTIAQSTISHNSSRGNDSQGGGIMCVGTTLIDRSLITGNTAERDFDAVTDSPSGGGIHCSGQLTIANSIISLNTAEGDDGHGGGLDMDNGTATIINTTINGNRAKGSLAALNGGEGGGIDAGGTFTLVNSTVSGNDADGSGGGIFAVGTEVRLINATIADNTSNADDNNGGAGGGVFVAFDTVVTMRNSVLADNVEGGIGNNDDCDGNIASGGNNVVQVINAGCSVSGGGGSDLLGIPAKLGAFAANGGPSVGASVSAIVAGMGTHLPASDSPLIDHGNPTGCKDAGDIDLARDQRGFLRPVDGPDPDAVDTCDVGAVEFGSFVDSIFADSFD